MRPPFQLIYDKLFHYYGPQGWWPAETSFEMMVGAILVQNTSWVNVEKAMTQLRPFLDPWRMETLSMDELARLIRPSGFYNIKAHRIKSFWEWLKTYQSDIEKVKKMDRYRLREELLSIHGIGRETADVMLLYAFDKPIFVVDAYARRIFYRLGCDMPESYDEFRLLVEAELPKDLSLFNEFHALLVEHAKVFCRQAPKCDGCPLFFICDRKL